MATSEAKEIKKQETLVRFSIISYKTRLRVSVVLEGRYTGYNCISNNTVDQTFKLVDFLFHKPVHVIPC